MQEVSIVVVCAAATDLTRHCLTVCDQLYPRSPIILVTEEPLPPGPWPPSLQVLSADTHNLSRKRNLGVEAAHTPFIAFLDDDATPLPGWLEAAYAALGTETTIGLVGGPNLSPRGQPPGRTSVGNACRSFLVAGPYGYRKRRATARDCDYLPACNVVFRRSTYLMVGGMDEAYPDIGDDLALCRRMRDQGLRIRYLPEVAVEHADRPLLGFALQRLIRGSLLVPGNPRVVLKNNASLLASAGFVCMLLCGPFLLFNPLTRLFFWGLTGIHGLVCFFEAARHSGRLTDFPGTLAAIYFGNLCPGVGLLLGKVGLLTDRSRWYRRSRAGLDSPQ